MANSWALRDCLQSRCLYRSTQKVIFGRCRQLRLFVHQLRLSRAASPAGLDEFEGFLVNVDEPCAAADLPGRTSPSNTAGSQNVTGNVGVQQEQVAAVPNRAALQKRRAFKPPAVVQRIEWQVPQPVLPIAKQPDAHLRPITSPAVVATMRTDGQRTGWDSFTKSSRTKNMVITQHNTCMLLKLR